MNHGAQIRQASRDHSLLRSLGFFLQLNQRTTAQRRFCLPGHLAPKRLVRWFPDIYTQKGLSFQAPLSFFFLFFSIFPCPSFLKKRGKTETNQEETGYGGIAKKKRGSFSRSF
jgi:hypothetical protein